MRVNFDIDVNEIEFCSICNVIPMAAASSIVNNLGLTTMSDISLAKDGELLSCRNIGKVTLLEIRCAVAEWLKPIGKYDHVKKEYIELKIERLNRLIDKKTVELARLVVTRADLILVKNGESKCP